MKNKYKVKFTNLQGRFITKLITFRQLITLQDIAPDLMILN